MAVGTGTYRMSSERVRGDVPQKLVERAKGLIPSGEEMSDAEFQRYVIRQFVRDRELEEMAASRGNTPRECHE